VIYAGSLLNPEILKYAKPDAELYDSAGMNLTDILKVMVDEVKKGKLVARVHDGDPSFFGAITEQMDFL
jgi:precorrin-4/cobalt-precorrin-4 C11-methyltransferase